MLMDEYNFVEKINYFDFIVAVQQSQYATVV